MEYKKEKILVVDDEAPIREVLSASLADEGYVVEIGNSEGPNYSRIRDPRETSLPAVGLVRWIDAETGQETVVDTSARATERRLRGLPLESGRDRLDGPRCRSGEMGDLSSW